MAPPAGEEREAEKSESPIQERKEGNIDKEREEEYIKRRGEWRLRSNCQRGGKPRHIRERKKPGGNAIHPLAAEEAVPSGRRGGGKKGHAVYAVGISAVRRATSQRVLSGDNAGVDESMREPFQGRTSLRGGGKKDQSRSEIGPERGRGRILRKKGVLQKGREQIGMNELGGQVGVAVVRGRTREMIK